MADLTLPLQGLLTEGLEVDMCPASLSITPLLPQSVKVMVKPQAPGQLRVLGKYSLVSSQVQPGQLTGTAWSAHRYSLVSSQAQPGQLTGTAWSAHR